MENTVGTEFLRPEMFGDLSLTGGVVEGLVDWVDGCNDFIGCIEGVCEIMVIFGGGYFFGIWIGALFGKIDSELVLDKITDEDAVTILEY